MENSHINESILSEEILEDQKKNRIDHMTYLPGMEDIGSDVMDQVISAMNAYDYEKYTRFDHPLLAASFVKKHKDKLSLSDEELNLMTRVISSHMGIWNKDFNDNEVLPVPKDKYERFVHLCDYLSSKKFLNVDFDGIDIKY